MQYQYVDGRTLGFDKSVKLHVNANLVGDITVGAGTRIDQCTITGNVTIGKGCHIADGVRIFGGHGVVINDHSGIGPGTTILTAMDDPNSDLIALHSENQLERAEKAGPVYVGRYVLIGAHCVLAPGVVIRDEVILGALSLAKGELLAGRVYAGIPAVEKRNRPKLRYTEAA